jgi:hypothetical protein
VFWRSRDKVADVGAVVGGTAADVHLGLDIACICLLVYYQLTYLFMMCFIYFRCFVISLCSLIICEYIFYVLAIVYLRITTMTIAFLNIFIYVL